MRLPQLVRDAVGLHLVWGQWMLSRARTARRFEHVVAQPATAPTRTEAEQRVLDAVREMMSVGAAFRQKHWTKVYSAAAELARRESK